MSPFVRTVRIQSTPVSCGYREGAVKTAVFLKHHSVVLEMCAELFLCKVPRWEMPIRDVVLGCHIHSLMIPHPL